MKFQIKNNKQSFYAVDDWLHEYDYEHNLMLQSASGINELLPKKNSFKLINWNKWNHKKMKMMDMFVMFSDPLLELKFILSNSFHIETTIK